MLYMTECLDKIHFSDESISNDLWRISERSVLKDFLVGNQVYTPWTEVKDQQLIKDWLTIDP
jgi:hypothetical protein